MESLQHNLTERVTHFGILAFCLLLGAGSGALLYLDLSGHRFERSGEVFASAEIIEGRVKRREPSGFLWERVSSGVALFRRESVQVGEGGSATLKLVDGRSLSLGENSLVVLEETKGMELNFVRGVFYLRGEGFERKITAETGKKAVVEELPVKLLVPTPGKRFFLDQAQSTTVAVDFSWKRLSAKSEKNDNAVLQVSRRRDFSDNLVPRLSAQSSAEKVSLPQGKYFWRVGAKGEIRTLEVTAIRGLAPVFPVAGDSVQSGPKGQMFKWALPEAIPVRALNLGKHRLEVSTAPDFKPVLFSFNVEATAQSFQSTAAVLKNSNYYWRVVSVYADLTLSSQVNSFAHEFLPPDETIPLLGPATSWTLSWTGGEKVPFRWERKAGESVVQGPLQLSLWRDSARKQPIRTWETESPEVLVAETDLAEGEVFWEVRAKGSERRRSALRRLVVRLPEWKTGPVPAEPADSHKFVGPAAKTCTLKWEVKDGFKRFKVSVRTSQKEVFQSTTERSQVDLRGLGEGVYEWSVRAVDRWNREQTWTQARTFIVDYGPKLRAPSFATPKKEKPP